MVHTHELVAKPARQFGHAMHNLNHYHYSFLPKLIVFTVYEHGNICIAWPNCRAGFATGKNQTVFNLGPLVLTSFEQPLSLYQNVFHILCLKVIRNSYYSLKFILYFMAVICTRLHVSKIYELEIIMLPMSLVYLSINLANN